MEEHEGEDTRGEGNPLEYQTPPPPASKAPVGTAGAIRGFICGVFLVIFAVCPVGIWQEAYMMTSASTRPVATRPPTKLVGMLFLLVMAAAVLGAVSLGRAERRNVFYLGLLIGVGVMALCQGICFVSQ